MDGGAAKSRPAGIVGLTPVSILPRRTAFDELVFGNGMSGTSTSEKRAQGLPAVAQIEREEPVGGQSRPEPRQCAL